jgi:hypothetical protein
VARSIPGVGDDVGGGIGVDGGGSSVGSSICGVEVEGGGFVAVGRIDVGGMGSVAVERGGGGMGVRVGVELGVVVGLNVGTSSEVPTGVNSPFSGSLFVVARNAAVAGEPGVLEGEGVTGSMTGTVVTVVVGVPFSSLANRKKAPMLRTSRSNRPPPPMNRRGSFHLRLFFVLGMATAGLFGGAALGSAGAVAATAAVVGAAGIKVGS